MSAISPLSTHAETAEAPRGLDSWELADYARTVGNLRADLTRAQLAASVLLEAVKPFAAVATAMRPGSFYANQPDGTHFAPLTTTLGDFRQAAEALASVQSLTSGESR